MSLHLPWPCHQFSSCSWTSFGRYWPLHPGNRPRGLLRWRSSDPVLCNNLALVKVAQSLTCHSRVLTVHLLPSTSHPLTAVNVIISVFLFTFEGFVVMVDWCVFLADCMFCITSDFIGRLCFFKVCVWLLTFVKRSPLSWLVPWENRTTCLCNWKPWTFSRICWEGTCVIYLLEHYTPACSGFLLAPSSQSTQPKQSTSAAPVYNVQFSCSRNKQKCQRSFTVCDIWWPFQAQQHSGQLSPVHPDQSASSVDQSTHGSQETCHHRSGPLGAQL